MCLGDNSQHSTGIFMLHTAVVTTAFSYSKHIPLYVNLKETV